jgi:basic amino acid/polyamine antiporter, APA family
METQQIEKNANQRSFRQERAKLPQTMGLREIVALGIGGTIGGAIFVLVGTAIDQAGPLGALVSFVLAFLIALVVALPYAELACRYPLTGGGYAFVQAILGRHWGFVMGWVYAGSWLFIGSYVTLGFGGYFQQVLSGILPTASKVPPIYNTLLLIIGILIINLTGGRLFARLQKFIVLLAVVALIGASLAGLYGAVIGLHGANIARFSPVLPHGISGILETASLAFLALSGFDIVATTGEEVKNPKRMLPLAILLTLGIILVLYLLVTAATAGVLSGHALSTKTPLADAAKQLFGGTGQQFISITAALTTAATGNAVLAATSRITFAMARDGLLPRFLASVHPSTKVPRLAIIVNGVIFLLLALTGSIALLATVGSFLYILQFIFPLAGLVIVRSRSKAVPSFHTPLPYLVFPLAFGGCFLLLYASGQKGMGVSLGWLIAGLVIHASFQSLTDYFYKKRYMKKGYTATTNEISVLKGKINNMLKYPQICFEELEAIQLSIAELKRLRTVQTRIEELQQSRSAQARIEELKQLRVTQARIEELELLQANQARIEEIKIQRATHAHAEELKFLQTIEMQQSNRKGIPVLENFLHETLKLPVYTLAKRRVAGRDTT